MYMLLTTIILCWRPSVNTVSKGKQSVHDQICSFRNNYEPRKESLNWEILMRKVVQLALTNLDWKEIKPASQLKEINPEYSSQDWCWSWSSNT